MIYIAAVDIEIQHDQSINTASSTVVSLLVLLNVEMKLVRKVRNLCAIKTGRGLNPAPTLTQWAAGGFPEF